MKKLLIIALLLTGCHKKHNDHNCPNFLRPGGDVIVNEKGEQLNQEVDE